MISSKLVSSSRNLAKLTLVPKASSSFKKSISSRLLHQSVIGQKIHKQSGFITTQALFQKSHRSFHTTTGMLGKADNPEADHGNPKLVTNEEWAKKLTPEQYFCAREGGTEPPFSGQYLNHKAEGLYTCICCGSELFSSKTKYDSGSGWPSFNAALEESSDPSNSAVIRRKDISHGMVRNEIICNNCNAHLGHVFEDGPEPTGERFCVNSAALKFVPKKLSS